MAHKPKVGLPRMRVEDREEAEHFASWLRAFGVGARALGPWIPGYHGSVAVEAELSGGEELRQMWRSYVKVLERVADDLGIGV